MASVVHGSALLDLLSNALEINRREVKRIVLDIRFDAAVNVYIERWGDINLLKVKWPKLDENIVELKQHGAD